MPTITATFETRREAELAVEHLVQEHGVNRDAVELGTEGRENSAGVEPDGADNPTELEEGTQDKAALNGRIFFSVNADGADTDAVRAVLAEYGAGDVAHGN